MTASILGSSKSVYKRQTTSLLAFDLFSSFSMSCVLYNISLIGAVILCTYLAVFHLVFLVFSKYSIEYEKNSHLINYTEKCFLLLFFFIFSSSSVCVFFFFGHGFNTKVLFNSTPNGVLEKQIQFIIQLITMANTRISCLFHWGVFFLFSRSCFDLFRCSFNSQKGFTLQTMDADEVKCQLRY